MKGKLSISKRLSNLTPNQFKKWFNAKFEGDWEKHYKEIGGVLPEKKKDK